MISSINSSQDYWSLYYNNQSRNAATLASANVSSSSIPSLLTISQSSSSSTNNSENELSPEEHMKMMQSRKMPPPPPKEGEEKTGTLPSEIDTDGDGTLSSDEYETLISTIKNDDTLSAEDFFTQYDTDDDGEITSEEMAAAKKNQVSGLMPPPPPEDDEKKVHTLPSDIDADGNGTLSSTEYETLISKLESDDALSSEDFFSKYDTDEDGEISSEEMHAAKADGALPKPPAPSKSESEDTASSESDYSKMIEELRALAFSTLNAYEKNYNYMFNLQENTALNSNA